MKIVGSGLRGIFDEPATRVSVLSRIARINDLHFLDAFNRRRTFMALLMAYCVSEGRAIEEILRRHCLAAIDAGVELASTEHRVTIRLHGQKLGLHLQ